MSDILLCTHNPMLVKGLYGILRDEGYHVELSEYPAHAVQRIMKSTYQAVILDSHSFGMSAEDAVKVIKALSPDIMVIMVGHVEQEADALSIEAPVDLEKLRDLIHNIQQISVLSHT